RASLAGFALYRALLRQIPRIPLPDDLLARAGWTHPIRYLVRSGFSRNKNDTSPRLITSAFKSGYRFLTLLSRAGDNSSSPQHGEIVDFLRDRQAKFPHPPLDPAPAPAPQKTRGTTPDPSSPAKPRDSEREIPPPLLTKISAPGEKPVYTSTFRPRPLAELTGGVRKVPVVDETTNIAFLRIGKPQSHWHANFLRRKAVKRYVRINMALDLWDEGRPTATEEDRWESFLARQAAEEGVDIRGGWTGEDENARQYGVHHIRQQLDDEAEDMIARGKAMTEIVEQEKKLAEREK
ncbi:hypothetical protein BD289DRAFT_357143, partial [Coniella lustricola]